MRLRWWMMVRSDIFLVSSVMKRGRMPGPSVNWGERAHEANTRWSATGSPSGTRRPGEGGRRRTDLLVEILLGPAVVLEVELGRALVAEVVLHDAERVEGGGVVAADLVGPDEQLDLEVVRDLARALA
jgi:hypothetical protein